MSRHKPNHPRRPRRKTNPVSELLRGLVGEQVPGGCDHCDAFIKTTSDIEHPDFFLTTVHHDDDCPWLATYEKGEAS